jgi:L-ribulose-5-phosphate 3-epimerase/hexulose-6-phosphate isomerase
MYTMKDRPIGIYEKAIPNRFDWATKIKIAKAAGYDFIEMSIDETDERLNRLLWSKEKRKYLKDLLWQESFYINSICLSGHRRYPFGSKDPIVRKKARAIMEQAIGLARDLGVSNIQLAGYDVYYEPSDDTTKALFLEGLKEATQMASSANVMLSLEIMDTPFMGTISRCMPYIEEVDSPWLKIYPDIGNLSQWTKKPEEELTLGIHHTVGIHLKDTLPGKFKCVPFGAGTVDFETFFKKIKALEFKGPFLVEMWADNKLEEDYDICVSNIKEARQWLTKKAGEGFYASC